MEELKGKLVRTNDNIIDQINFVGNGFDHKEDYLFTLSKNDIEQFSNYENQMFDYIGWSIANTPQELIQVGDLVEHVKNVEGEKEQVVDIDLELGYIETRLFVLHISHITAIYTPNKDKTQYTLQWKKGE